MTRIIPFVLLLTACDPSGELLWVQTQQLKCEELGGKLSYDAGAQTVECWAGQVLFTTTYRKG